ncbi:MAG: NAD(P)/FAD-dependent oxidoreductase [Candidatus Bathyarchaeota archaeon]|nr:NAD(P)/FAD-dependent oxidoreductase [Candidatus Bathyarchaeota archaeon]
MQSTVVIVGGGPAGSFAAYELAKRGVDVSVFEEHSQIGVPSHCAGHLSIKSLKNLGLYPLPKGVLENEFSGVNFYSSNGTKFAVCLSKPVTCAVNRELFDKYLAEKAQAAGAKYFFGSHVSSLIVEDDYVKGIHVINRERLKVPVEAKVVIDAEGISARLLRQVGLSPFSRDSLVYAVEAEVENVRNVEENAVEVYMGSNYAPGFYAWLIPRLDGTAKLGLAVKKGSPKDFLERLLRKHPVASNQLRDAKFLRVNFHAIPIGGLIKKAYGNGFLAVGDCASQVKPTTGGGVIFGVSCARIAAEVASQALKIGDVSATSLKLYMKRVQGAFGFDSQIMLRLRNFFNTLSDEQLDNVLRFATKTGFASALRNIEEIDFQGHTLINVFMKPSAYATLVYLAYLYMSANA